MIQIMLTEGGMYVSGEVVHLPMVSLCSSKKKTEKTICQQEVELTLNAEFSNNSFLISISLKSVSNYFR